MSGPTKRRLKDALRGFMDRDVEDLTVEELGMAERSLRAARADAHEEDNETLERAASKALELLNRHRQERYKARYLRDKADGRHD
jgi:hypothetical protein